MHPPVQRICRRALYTGTLFFLFWTNTVFAKGITLPSGDRISPPTGLTDYIGKLYNLGLILVGLTAFFALVFAGVEYTVSAGNPSRQSDAKDRIKNAIYGIVLLLFATLLFNTINPELLQQPFQ